ncbi:MAG: hypothetical protein HOJ35_10245 [Bdellovibrionales bacterium]|jgi:parvulin-like peptidyl-prolyl isomerase|nr:hypothetical protein [Bdellovibrionales bacterium]
MYQSICVFFISILFSAASFSSSPNDVVAKVNNRKILFSEFEKSYQKNKLFVSDKLVTKRKVLLDLINRELGIQRARQDKLQNDLVVKEKMEDVLYHAQISKDLEPKLKEIVVSENEVKKYYQNHKEYRTAHILFRMTANHGKNENKAAIEQAIKTYHLVKKNPDKFSEFANKYSQTNVAPIGGDLGYQVSVRLAPEYFTAINNRPINYITPPVKTQFGYHIIKVLAVKDYNEINKPLYKKIVYDTKRDQVLDQYFTNLRKNASINIEEKYLQ